MLYNKHICNFQKLFYFVIWSEKKNNEKITFSLQFENNETNEYLFLLKMIFSIVNFYPPPLPTRPSFQLMGWKKRGFSNTDNTWVKFFFSFSPTWYFFFLSISADWSYFRFDFKLFITGVNGCLYNSPVASLAGAHLKLSSTARRHICIGPYHYLYNRRSSNHTCAWEISNVYTTLLRERLGENYSEAVIIDEHD